MRNYELVYIIHPDLDESALEETMTRVNSWITESGGEIIETEIWGKRRLAYPIKKQIEGNYVLQQIKLEPQSCLALEQNLNFLEPVMRYLLVSN